MSTKYTYEVRPKVPMRNFIPGKMINRPTVLQLDKDEVKNAIKFGPVYRRFDTTHVERVTLANLDELHRPSYINVAPNNIIKVEEKEEVTLDNLNELNKSSYINVAPNNIIETEEDNININIAPNNIIEASIEETPSEDSAVDNGSIEEVADDDSTNNASVEEVVDSNEDTLPDTPVDDNLGSEESSESSEEENVIKETENDSELISDLKSENSNTNIYHTHKKKRHR